MRPAKVNTLEEKEFIGKMKRGKANEAPEVTTEMTQGNLSILV